MQLQRIRVKKDDNYTTINNTIIKNKFISLKAKGLFLTVMSLADSWDFSINGITTILKENQSAIYSAINELIEYGFCERKRHYENGKIQYWYYLFIEMPVLVEENLLQENLNIDILNIGNQAQLNTNLNKVKKENKKPTKQTDKTENDAIASDCSADNSFVPESVSEAWCDIQQRKGILPTTAVKQLGRLTKEFGAAAVNSSFIAAHENLKFASDAQAYLTAILSNPNSNKPNTKLKKQWSSEDYVEYFKQQEKTNGRPNSMFG